MSLPSSPLIFGDVMGFLALAFIGATALLMFVRAKLLKAVGNLSVYRLVHIVIAALAGAFIVIHAAIFISYPFNVGILLGYASFALAAVVWVTGAAFLEKVRDSLFFHGPLSLGLGGLILIHAATEGLTLPTTWAELALAAVAAIAFANAVYHMRRVVAHG